MPEPLYKCWVKATDKEGGTPRYSQNWAAAKRAFFRVYDDRMECGNWLFKFDQIQNPVIYRTKQLFIPVSVLKIEFEERTYQFGFNPWVDPAKFIPMEIGEEKVKLKYSSFSIVLRLLVLAYALYFLWSTYIQN